MKKQAFKISVFLTLIVGIAAWAFYPAETKLVDELELGSTAPMTDVEVKDVSGEMLTLSEVARENGLLVIFSCNTCPWVHQWEDRYNPIANLAKEKGIGMIALNPNTTYRDRGDGFEDMKQRAQEKNYQFPYAVDANNKLADAFGATRTPHIFLFNSDLKLVYRGAIDDNAKSAENVDQHYLRDAINQLTAGEEISTKTSKSLGCTIKRAR
ncbi:thioredoxin family protein [Aliifodinibius sp. S!AR15-10]|uniref:thioredoxin family protein n=1 Tax=Aliifodinibius sp. S!AR15-10 TaxID=2950437 RepID=UPI00286161B9|nr:thioredoxin family protein [Aliifodinibius sp. S!AR15-10]MDR8391788.1 thioredoxin family protein [Aliifodinibius sp. S!AR15-10]